MKLYCITVKRLKATEFSWLCVEFQSTDELWVIFSENDSEIQFISCNYYYEFAIIIWYMFNVYIHQLIK